MSQAPLFYDPDAYRMENSVGYLLKMLSQGASRELDRRMAGLGLTDAQWKPLLFLQQGAGSTAADLARVGCQDTGAVTRLLDRLEAKGLLRRVRSAEDRRIVNLELTEDGARVATEVPKIIAGLANQLLAGFSPEEFEHFLNFLHRARGNLQTIEQGGGA